MLELLQTIASFGTLLSVLVAIWVIHIEERRRRERTVYERVGAEWTDFLQIALEYSRHDPMNIEIVKGVPASVDENQRIALHSLFVTMVGRVWRAYKDQPELVRMNRWSGWELSLTRWVARPDFAPFWLEHGAEYDADFVEFVNQRFGLRTDETETEIDRRRVESWGRASGSDYGP